MSEAWIAVLSSGALVAAIEGVREYFVWRRNRKAAKQDKAEATAEKNQDDLNRKVDALIVANRYILYDRIKYLAECYIEDKEVLFEDRRMLHKMHKSYHYGLNGNGDLDLLMAAVDELPLKMKEK